jgi:hypothetical protein
VTQIVTPVPHVGTFEHVLNVVTHTAPVGRSRRVAFA